CFYFFPRDSRGKERTARIKRIVAHEWLVFFNQVITASINHEKATQLLRFRRCASRQALIKVQPFGVGLTPEDALQVLRCLYQLQDHLALLRRKAGGAERHLHLLEFCQLRVNVLLDWFLNSAMVPGRWFLLRGFLGVD